uniref:diguanylate cyclase domain-containing protein n=1 Tax=Acetatifactor sp. TaxID=1872090 RepID=UPI004056EB9D
MRKRIGIVSAGWNEEYQQNILKGITDACEHYNFDTLSFTSSNIDFVEYIDQCAYNIFNLLTAESIDGIILVINTIYYQDVIQSIVNQVTQMNIPAVCVDSEHPGMIMVGTDNYASTRIMVEHLFTIDERQRFACITGVPYNPESEIRVQAFKDVITERLGSYEENYIYTGYFQYEHGVEAADFWHDSNLAYPDAVFCCNDRMAVGFMDRSRELGYRIPEDVRVVGYDNSYLGQDYSIPLSSMACPLVEVGYKSVEMLHQAFSNPDSHSTKELVMGIPHFRESSGVTENVSREEYINLYNSAVRQNREDNDSLFLANMMVENFSFVSSADDFLPRLQSIIQRIPCDEFYMCFTKEQMQSMGDNYDWEEGEPLRYMLAGYPSHMYLIMHYEYGNFCEPQIFETRKILPIFSQPKDKRVDYVLFPLCFAWKNHGYCVLGNYNNMAYRGAFQTWCELLSYAVSTIYLRHDLAQKTRQLEYLYERDSMTETYNRLGFKKHGQKMLEECIANGSQMMVLFADMDGMKAINDQYGHDEGDVAICAFSNILKANCLHGEIVSRFGGDEMVVLGTHYSQDMAEDFVTRFQKGLDHFNTGNSRYQLRVSVGYELLAPDETTDIENCVKQADIKMYVEKRRRKNQ